MKLKFSSKSKIKAVPIRTAVKEPKPAPVPVNVVPVVATAKSDRRRGVRAIGGGLFAVALILFCHSAVGQPGPVVPRTTPYTRTLLDDPDAATARLTLGIAGTNVTALLIPDEVTIETNADLTFSVIPAYVVDVIESNTIPIADSLGTPAGVAAGAGKNAGSVTNVMLAALNVHTNTIYVDPVNGNDNTGTYGAGRPYKSLGAALTNTVWFDGVGLSVCSNVVIEVLPGRTVEHVGITGEASEMLVGPGTRIIGKSRSTCIIGAENGAVHVHGENSYISQLAFASGLLLGSGVDGRIVDCDMGSPTTMNAIKVAVGNLEGYDPYEPSYTNTYMLIEGCNLRAFYRGYSDEDNTGVDTNISAKLKNCIIDVQYDPTLSVEDLYTNTAYGVTLEQASNGKLLVENCEISVSGAQTNIGVCMMATNSYIEVYGSTLRVQPSVASWLVKYQVAPRAAGLFDTNRTVRFFDQYYDHARTSGGSVATNITEVTNPF